jgi:hypothetical protein
MGSSDPTGWDPALDAVAAAPENHQVLYEDDVVRVLSVSVPAGVRERPHHHRWPSVFVVDRLARVRDHDGVTGNEIPLPLPDKLEFPVTLKFPPQPLHFVENIDDQPFHATRVEFKRGFPSGV